MLLQLLQHLEAKVAGFTDEEGTEGVFQLVMVLQLREEDRFTADIADDLLGLILAVLTLQMINIFLEVYKYLIAQLADVVEIPRKYAIIKTMHLN